MTNPPQSQDKTSNFPRSSERRRSPESLQDNAAEHHKTPKVKKITKLYYSNPKIQQAITEFSQNRETIPRYYQGFGKRPDTLQYPSDVTGAAGKGATSFHCSEEIWHNPLEINSEMSQQEFSNIRKSWDLLIDIDSPFLDYSKIAAELIIEVLEKYGIQNYAIKFSGSKGFHIIVPGKAFPETFKSIKTSEMFPEWPRAISEFLLYEIRPKYNRIVSSLGIDFKALETRTNLKKEDITTTVCPNCQQPTQKLRQKVTFKCDRCNQIHERPNYKLTKRRLRCTDDLCSGYFQVIKKEDYFFCENCKTSSINKLHNSDKKIVYSKEAKSSLHSSKFKEEVSGEAIASLDLVLVAPRHLFRSPYSLHEKTALASIVINKEDIKNFSPSQANPLKVKEIKSFYPTSKKNEALRLLEAAIAWKSIHSAEEEQQLKKKYQNYEKIKVEGVTEDLFPKPIKKLLKGLAEGRKRGAFILITFLRSLNFSPEYINKSLRDWNEKNDPPLKEGYLRSQIDWHIKQKKQILPPNYANKNFYKDLNLLGSNSMPKYKNPISEVLSKVRQQN